MSHGHHGYSLAGASPVGELASARDRALVGRIAQGTPGATEALASLFQTYAPVALALARRVTRHDQLAEEAVQEAFCGLWNAPDRYDATKGTVRAYLLTTVHHQAVDAVRREQKHRHRQGEPATGEQHREQTPDIAEEIADEAETGELRSAVMAALTQLPGEQRLALQMMYFDGKTQQVIADELALPLGTVKSRVLLAMRKLRATLIGRKSWGEDDRER